MPKIRKDGEYASPSIHRKEKRKKKNPLTHEQKNYIDRHIKQKIETHKNLFDPLM